MNANLRSLRLEFNSNFSTVPRSSDVPYSNGTIVLITSYTSSLIDYLWQPSIGIHVIINNTRDAPCRNFDEDMKRQICLRLQPCLQFRQRLRVNCYTLKSCRNYATISKSFPPEKIRNIAIIGMFCLLHFVSLDVYFYSACRSRYVLSSFSLATPPFLSFAFLLFLGPVEVR